MKWLHDDGTLLEEAQRAGGRVRSLAPTGGSKASLSSAQMCTTSRRIPESFGSNEKDCERQFATTPSAGGPSQSIWAHRFGEALFHPKGPCVRDVRARTARGGKPLNLKSKLYKPQLLDHTP